ncbi:MAG: rhodanese-like domain-containing protein [Spirochaetota bacterium]
MAGDMKGFLQRTLGIGVGNQFEPNYEELKKLVDSDSITLLDVRSVREYQRGHIPGAVLTPPASLDPQKLQVEKDSPIVVYCASGGRSEYAKGLLERAGFTNVRNFGGVNRWEGELVHGDSPSN